jgi:hypothetical protein
MTADSINSGSGDTGDSSSIEGGSRKLRKPASGVPARGYSWGPFREGEPGARLVTGYRSKHTIAKLSRTLAARLMRERPDLEPFAFAVSAWARWETLARVCEAALDHLGPLDENGQPRERLLKEYRAADRRAAEERIRLGLDPRSAAALARERVEAARGVIDLDAIRERGREALTQRQAIGGGGDAS